MRFTIIITAHNLEDFIKKAIESAESQTFKDREIIVVCDSCTDNTVPIARQHDVQIIETDFHAPGPARNAGLDIASGEYVLFLDGDDWYLHAFVLEMINKAALVNEFDVLNLGFIYGRDGYVGARHPIGGCWVNVWSRVWRREFIGAERFGNARYAEDAEFCNRMFAKPVRMTEWHTPIIYYTYPREGSLSEEAAKNESGR